MSSQEEAPKLTPETRRTSQTMACVGCMAAIVLTMLAVFLFIAISTQNGWLTRTYESWRDLEKCRQNLGELGSALQRYNNTHRDYPEALQQLYPDFLMDNEVLWCPTVKERNGDTKYEYLPPDDNADSTTVVARCLRHRPMETDTVVLELLLDGRVERRTVPTETPEPASTPDDSEDNNGADENAL